MYCFAMKEDYLQFYNGIPICINPNVPNNMIVFTMEQS